MEVVRGGGSEGRGSEGWRAVRGRGSEGWRGGVGAVRDSCHVLSVV